MGIAYRVMASTGEYTDRDGQTKKRWQQCGAVFEKDGRLSLKLESLPVGPDWSGWFSLFEPDNDKPKPQARRQAPPDFDDMNEPPF